MNFLIYTINEDQRVKVMGYSDSQINSIKLIKQHLSEFIINKEGREKLDSVFITEKELKTVVNFGYFIVTNDDNVIVYRKYQVEQETDFWIFQNKIIKESRIEKLETYYIVESKIEDDENLRINLTKSMIQIDNN
jgi:hypothetical protein